MIEPPPLKKRSWFLIISLAIFLVVSGFSIFFQFQKYQLQKNIQNLNTKKITLTSSPEQTQKETTLSAALLMKQKLQSIEKSQLKWSKIVEKIEQTLPKTKATNEPIVNFRSYGGNAEGTISVSAATHTASTDPLADIAATVAAFDADPSFHNVFIPSITKSIASDGTLTFNFSLTFDYKNPTF